MIDITQHVLAESNAETPSSCADTIDKLGEQGILTPEFASDFSRIAGLQNVVVHAYDKLDIERIIQVMPKLMKDTEIFLGAVRTL